MKCVPTAWLAGVLSALVLGIGLSGFPVSEARADKWPADTYVLRVDGLACPYCAYGVEKQFAQREGVEATDINIEKGVVLVTVTDGTRFSDSELKRIVHDAGFELGNVVHRPGNG